MDTEGKLQQLKIIYPTYDEDTLLEIVVMCDGSVEGAKSIIGDNSDTNNGEDVPVKEFDLDLDNQLEGMSSKFFKGTKSDFTEELEVDREVDVSRDITSLPQDQSDVKALSTECSSGVLISHKEAPSLPTKEAINISSLIGKKRNVEDDNETPNKRYNLDTLKTNRTIKLVSKSEIQSALPNVRVFKNFLSKELANELLNVLESQKMLFQAKQFYIAGKLCTSSQKSIVYSNNGNVDYDPVYTTDKYVEHYPPACLMKAQAIIQGKVNEVLGEVYGEHCDTPSYMIKSNWKPDICVGNYYPNNKSHLDWHSDKLTNIGPLATIASISFGANRIFRLRRSWPTNSTIYNIPLPNNTLLIMLPSTQEVFKHCVPSLQDSLVMKDKTVGETRYNLTFRMIHPLIKEKKHVSCDICKQRMILRRLFKGNDTGYYVWMCMASFKGTTCKGFKYANFEADHDGAVKLETKDKNEATRWLCASER